MGRGVHSVNTGGQKQELQHRAEALAQSLKYMPYNVRGPAFHPCPHVKGQVWWHTLLVLTLGKQRKEGPCSSLVGSLP